MTERVIEDVTKFLRLGEGASYRSKDMKEQGEWNPSELDMTDPTTYACNVEDYYDNSLRYL